MKVARFYGLHDCRVVRRFLRRRTLQAQATSTITGVVKDSAGGVIPGASVVVTSNATGTKFETVTNSIGRVHRAGAARPASTP